MSLNRCEDALLDYVRTNPDEKRFWTTCVLEHDRSSHPRGEKVAALERELRVYAAERGRADARVQELFGGGRVSLRNLAEHLLAVWTPPRPAAKKRG